MASVGAMEFWREYKRELQRTSSWELWNGPAVAWTANCLRAAEAVMTSRNLRQAIDPFSIGVREPSVLKISREYFRIDVIGETSVGDCDWTLEVAYEHENSDRNRWIQEFCKLTHVVAALRVIAGYFDPGHGEPMESFLQRRVNQMESRNRRVTRVPDSQWLFILGPKRRATERGDRFHAFTLDGTRLESLSDEDYPLSPSSWPHTTADAGMTRG
jgi:hypothetical protein